MVSTVGTDGAAGFAAGISALLKSGDLDTAVNAPDAATIDAAIGKIDHVLDGAHALGTSLSSRAAAAAQVDLESAQLGTGTAGIATGGSG